MNNKADTECVENIVLQVKVHRSYLKPRAYPKVCGSLCSSFHRLVKMDQGFIPHPWPLDANELPKEIFREPQRASSLEARRVQVSHFSQRKLNGTCNPKNCNDSPHGNKAALENSPEGLILIGN